MKKYRYTVVSDEYVGALTRLRKTGRKVTRPAQVLFNPSPRMFGLDSEECLRITHLAEGETHVDRHGDVWERVQ